MRKILLTVGIFLTILSSCQQNENVETLLSSEDIVREIGFIHPNLNSVNTRSIGDADILGGGTTFDFIARIARPKTGCKKGLGLCDVRIIEGPIPSPTPDTEVITRASSMKNDKYDCITTCKFDNTGKGVAYFILSGSPSSQGLSMEAMPPFCVDEEMEQPLESNSRNSITVLPGEYPYQKSLGEHGGYTVNVIYNETE